MTNYKGVDRCEEARQDRAETQVQPQHSCHHHYIQGVSGTEVGLPEPERGEVLLRVLDPLAATRNYHNFSGLKQHTFTIS